IAGARIDDRDRARVLAPQQPGGLSRGNRHREAFERIGKAEAERLHIRLLAGPAVEEALRPLIAWQSLERCHFLRREKPCRHPKLCMFGFKALDVAADRGALADREEAAAIGMRKAEPQMRRIRQIRLAIAVQDNGYLLRRATDPVRQFLTHQAMARNVAIAVPLETEGRSTCPLAGIKQVAQRSNLIGRKIQLEQ